MILRPAGGAAAALGGGDGDMEQPDEELSPQQLCKILTERSKEHEETREHRLHEKAPDPPAEGD